MSQAKAPMRIRYTYEPDPGLRTQYAHGVWGGINAQGEVEINFYTESDKLPAFSECLVTDGNFGHEMVPYDENLREMTRHVHAKIILNYHTARDVLEWLSDKVETLEMDVEGNGYAYRDDDDREQ